jgi:hypothetical protein
MPKDRPFYHGYSSVMDQVGLNPGLGFRPQIDVEDHFIIFNPKIYESEKKFGYRKYTDNLKLFLENSKTFNFN